MTLRLLCHKSLPCWPGRAGSGRAQTSVSPTAEWSCLGRLSHGEHLCNQLGPPPGPSGSYLLAVGDLVLPHSATLWQGDGPRHAQRGGAAVLQLDLGGLWVEQRVWQGCEEPPRGQGTSAPRPLHSPGSSEPGLRFFTSRSRARSPGPGPSPPQPAQRSPESVYESTGNKIEITAPSCYFLSVDQALF